MESKQHSRKGKGRKSVSCLGRKSEWAAWMNGVEPEWMNGKQAQALAKVFGGNLPAWVIESEPWREATPERFKLFRKELMGITQVQCAYILGVSQGEISAWESGKKQLPRSAFEALRWLQSSISQRLSHKCWEGWFVSRSTGRLVSPDYGNLAVTPEEVSGLPVLQAQLAGYKSIVARQMEEISRLEGENCSLRAMDSSMRIAGELEAMQKQIGVMLAGIKTAQIIPFELPGTGKQQARA